MTSYGVDSDTVPNDGFPYYADLCPTCRALWGSRTRPPVLTWASMRLARTR